MGCIFQKFDRIWYKKVLPKHNDKFSGNHTLTWVNMWGTPTHQSTTTLCMQSQHEYIFFFVGIRLTTYIMV